jgi:hypothetical protein
MKWLYRATHSRPRSLGEGSVSHLFTELLEEELPIPVGEATDQVGSTVGLDEVAKLKTSSPGQSSNPGRLALSQSTFLIDLSDLITILQFVGNLQLS